MSEMYPYVDIPSLEEIDKMDTWEGAQLNTAKKIPCI